MAGTPLATAFVRIVPEPGSLERGFAAETAAARAPVITPRVNTAPAEGQLREFISGVGGKLLGALAIGEVLKSGFEAQADYQRGLAQLEAGLKSTGEVAGVTAEDMEKLADKISAYSGQNRNAIVASEQMLISFTNIRDVAGENNDILTQAIKVSADLAARFGGSASDSAIKLGKALNDPVKGLTALTRVGVTFDDQQKNLIKTLVASGDTMGAQKIILAELNKEFGGSAKAVGSTLSGELNKAKNAFEELSGEIVGAVAPALDLVVTAAVDLGKAFFGGVKFLNEHKAAVAGVVAAYAALKFEAIAGAVASFAGTATRALDGVALKALYAGDALRTLGGGSLLLGTLAGGAALAGVGLLTYGLLQMGGGAKEAQANVDKLLAGLDPNKLGDATIGISRLQEALKGGIKQSSFSLKDTGIHQYIDELAALKKLTDAQEAAQGKIDLVRGATAQLSHEYNLSKADVQDLAKVYHIDLTANMGEVEKKFASVLKLADGSSDAMKRNAGAAHDLAVGNIAFNKQTGANNKALQGQIDLLAGVSNQSKLTAADLLQQAESSLIAIARETTNIQQLAKKGLDPTSIKALVDKGPEYVQAANDLSIKDLKLFGKTYQTELSAQWEKAAAVTSLGATKADRKAIDAIIAGQGAMDGATGKIAASVTTAFLHEHPKAYAAAHDLYTVVQGEVDKLHGKELQILLDDLASGNIDKLREDLSTLTTQLATLQQTNVLGVPGVQLMLNNPKFQADGGIENHAAQIAPAGAWRVWAEPETGGEAYIPLAPSKRARSVDIWKQVGHRLGVKFDSGGILAPSDLASIDRTYRWAENDEPLVGQFANFDGHIKNALNNITGLAAAGSVGGGAQQWAPLVLQVLAELGQSAAWLPNVLRQINTESGGNPNAINLWDSNAAQGTPSKGILQTIDPTFYANAGPYAGLGPYNAHADIYAGLHYALGRYGSLGVLGQGHGYDNGGPLMPGWTMGVYNGTGRPENVRTGAQEDALLTAVQAASSHGPTYGSLLHVENFNGDQTDVKGILSAASMHARAHVMTKRI